MPLALWNIGVCLVEATCYSYLHYKKIPTRKIPIIRLYISIVVLTLVSSSLTVFFAPYQLKLCILAVSNSVCTFFCYGWGSKKRWLHCFLWNITPIAIATAADYVSYSIAALFMGEALDTLQHNPIVWVQISLIYLLIILLITIILTQSNMNKAEIPLWIHYAVFAFVTMGILASQLMIDIGIALYDVPETMHYANILFVVGYTLIMLLFILLISFTCLGKMIANNRRLHLQNQMSQMDAQQYEFMVTTSKSLSAWKHDYLGQLRILKSLAQSGKLQELDEYAQNMESVLGVTEHLLVTGNTVVDTVVSLRMADAKQRGIPFEAKVHLPQEIRLSPVSLSSLLGNLLDNALESCTKLEHPGEGIYLEIKPWKQMLYFHCMNTSDGQYTHTEAGELRTSKKEIGHGIGIIRMRDIVESAGGTFSIQEEDTQFSVNIFLPMEEGII